MGDAGVADVGHIVTVATITHVQRLELGKQKRQTMQACVGGNLKGSMGCVGGNLKGSMGCGSLGEARGDIMSSVGNHMLQRMHHHKCHTYHTCHTYHVRYIHTTCQICHVCHTYLLQWMHHPAVTVCIHIVAHPASTLSAASTQAGAAGKLQCRGVGTEAVLAVASADLLYRSVVSIIQSTEMPIMRSSAVGSSGKGGS